MSNPNAAEHKRDNDDDNNDACKQQRRQDNDDDVNHDDDDDVDKQAHRHHVGSLGPGCTLRGSAREGQGTRWTPACGAAANSPAPLNKRRSGVPHVLNAPCCSYTG